MIYIIKNILRILVYLTYLAFFSFKRIREDEHCILCIGRSCNSAVLVSRDKKGIILIDTKKGRSAKILKRYIDSIFSGSNITIINTHSHEDHSAGNILYGSTKIIAGVDNKEKQKRELYAEGIPDVRIPPGKEEVVQLDEELLHIKNMGRAHTYNDTIVYLEKRRILFIGDLAVSEAHPLLCKNNGSHVGKWIDVLNEIYNHYPAVKVIPGHGPVGDMQTVSAMREYFSSIKDAVNNKEKLKKLKKKFKNYFYIPGMTGFSSTLKFIKEG